MWVYQLQCSGSYCISQNLFKDGAVVVLHSKASGKTIRVKPDGEVDGEGDEGSSGEFVCVHNSN